MKVAIPISGSILNESSRDFTPTTELFIHKKGIFPAHFTFRGYYNVVNLFNSLEQQFKIDFKRSIGDFFVNNCGELETREVFVCLRDDLYLKIKNESTENYVGNRYNNESFDEDGLRIGEAKLKLEFTYDSRQYNIDWFVDFKKTIDKEFGAILKSQGSLHLITQEHGSFDLKSFKIQKTEIDLELNYGKEFKELYKYILNRLNKKETKGLVLLHGLPGTGKSYLVRHLIHNIEGKRLIYVPPNLIDYIADPSFINFLLDYPNSILVIEDGENILKSRKSGGSQAVSNLLNVSDGLLSDCLNIQIICTFNCEIGELDQALLRKGRLIAKHKFEKLSTEETQNLFDHLKINKKAKEPMTLAEIYNHQDLGFEEERTKIGFK